MTTRHEKNAHQRSTGPIGTQRAALLLTAPILPSQDPTSAAALGLQHRQQGGKMASDEGSRAESFVEADQGIPRHVGGEKQLHSATGYNLVIDAEGNVYGTREPYNSEAVLRFHSRAVGHIQIKGKSSNMFLAMNEKGRVYAEPDEESENTWFQETYEDGWNQYKWLGNQKDWYLGIKKSGKMKHGHRTKRGQKAVKFVPRSSEPAQ